MLKEALTEEQIAFSTKYRQALFDCMALFLILQSEKEHSDKTFSKEAAPLDKTFAHRELYRDVTSIISKQIEQLRITFIATTVVTVATPIIYKLCKKFYKKYKKAHKSVPAESTPIPLLTHHT